MPLVNRLIPLSNQVMPDVSYFSSFANKSLDIHVKISHRIASDLLDDEFFARTLKHMHQFIHIENPAKSGNKLGIWGLGGLGGNFYCKYDY